VSTLPISEPRPLLRGWVHAAALPFALAGTVVLVTEAPGPWWAALVFGLCLVGLYATSSIYHVPRWNARAKWILSRFDLAAIQLTIVGTFTPVAFHALDGAWRAWSLGVAWTLGFGGIAFALSGLRPPRWVGPLCYMGVGWLTIVPFTRIIDALPWQGSTLIVLGGVLYTLGALVYATRRPDPFPRWFGYHEVFHVLVVAASTAHYLAIWRYVLPIG
jgi:hemolysin III